MQKVLLIGDSSLFDSPYLNIYFEVFDKLGIEYDLIYWNKKLEHTDSIPSNYYSYDKSANNQDTYLAKIFQILGYIHFVKRHIMQQQYAFVVIFSIAHAIPLCSFLIKYYDNRYVFDIRDYSPLCHFVISLKIIKKIIKHSSFTAISSRGFLKWLPIIHPKYIISHNTTISAVSLFQNCLISIKKTRPLRILTIGQLRDTHADLKLIKSLARNPSYLMVFAGFGPTYKALSKYATRSQTQNVTFTGQYHKSEEIRIIKDCDMINIILDHDTNSDTLMSNRFYHSVLHCKPMIVRDGCFQATICKKYNLGLVIKKDDNLAESIENYLQSFDMDVYMSGRKLFIDLIMNDMSYFSEKLRFLYSIHSGKTYLEQQC